MKKFWNFFISTRLMSVLIVLFAVAMAVATFIENDYGTQTAKALIYNAWWFELIMLLLTLNFTGNIFRYNLLRKEKWPVLLFHIAFIVILLGAFITRYFGYEGLMPIREGSTSNVILSDITYVTATVDNGKEQKVFEKEVLFGALSNNHFKMKEHFRETSFEIEYVDLIPNAKTVFVPNVKGPKHLHLVFSDANGRKDVYLAEHELLQIGNQFYSFNKPMPGVMNFVQNDSVLLFQPIEKGTFMEMQTREFFEVPQDSILPAQFAKLYNFPSTQFVVKEFVNGEKSVASAPKEEKGMFSYDALYVHLTSGSESQQVVLQGSKNTISEPKLLQLNGLNFQLHYGSKAIKTPFALKLKDFQLERYPGTNSPSSYASEVRVLDQSGDFDYRIFMNHVLDYKGYRFFQSSYDPDELGTVLSVNHDYWGTLITYIGYALMSLGMFLTLFWKGSRFQDLVEKLGKLKKNKLVISLLFLGLTSVLSAQEPARTSQKYVVSKEHAEKFGELLIQDFQGRIKPVNTYALEAMRKIYKKDTYQGYTAEQVILSAQIDPYAWGEEYLIHVKPNALGKKMSSDLQVKDGYTSAANFFRTGSYYLEQPVNNASIKRDLDKTSTDKEIINLNDRFNVMLEVLNGNLLHIYPKIGDPNNKWFSGIDKEAFVAQDTMILKMHDVYLQELVRAVETNDYSKADEYLGYIKAYQLKMGASIIPASKKIDLEIKYNKWEIFKFLMMFYMLVGSILLSLSFKELFTNTSNVSRLVLNLFIALTALGLLIHFVGLGVRWYISGHAPWSNGYEAVVFVASITVLAGLIFSIKKSKFILAVAVILASLLMGIAHGSSMNPEITNLVPVLKSYWLMIHVAVITSSYGFLGLSAILGLNNLLLYIMRNKNNYLHLNKTIDEITFVNEMAMTVGLFTLSIGTFLGGVWANESWGRYWSWDPKEVWSLISMMVYIFILHMRLVPGLRGKFAFNFASLWSISTLIMTFFGVNFYLSGMHSYATGDPVPFPTWAYIAIAIFVVFSILSYWKYSRVEYEVKKIKE
jgi:cytochrome c-type biogenesis protein CcsB